MHKNKTHDTEQDDHEIEMLEKRLQLNQKTKETLLQELKHDGLFELYMLSDELEDI